MAELPTGTVSFLFTDIERSTRLLDQDALTMRNAFVRHHELLRRAVEQHLGVVFETVGDAVYAVFAKPSDALEAAIDAQQALHTEDWGPVGPIRARMAIHSGEVAARDDYHYVGAPLVRCARLLVLGHGGQTLLSQTTVALVRDSLPSRATVRDLGEHKLKDLRSPEHVFQLDAPGLPTLFPPLRSSDARPHNLPAQATNFVGRAAELAEVRRLLVEARLLTLVGIGGVGKTRLALRAASDALGELADGAWFVDLSAVDQAASVEQEVATTLGVRDEEALGLRRALVEHVRDKDLLVILDNCEHLVEACAKLAALLLRVAPKLRIIATSRTPLETPGEHVWHVEGLDEAVSLFLDRAAQAANDFKPDEAAMALIERICTRLDRLPLAVELAARRVRALSLKEIDERLEDRFRLLGGTTRSDRRHETLRATIDWSYRLLTENESRLWTRLAVFVGGFTLDHAEAVCGDSILAEEDVLDLITSLVDKSLLVVERWPDGSIRYREPETLRAYARERSQEYGETDAVARRHAERLLAFAERGKEAVLGGKDQALWVERVSREKDNVHAAIAWALDHGEPGVAARLGLACGRVWTIRWLASEWNWWLDSIEPHVATLPDLLRAETLMLMGNMYVWRDEYERATAAIGEALGIFRSHGHSSGQREALLVLGGISADRGDDTAAERYYEDALALIERAEGRSEAAAHLGLGQIALRRGDLAAAREHLERSAAIRRTLGDSVMVARALLSLAQVSMDMDDLATAELHAQESLDLFTALDAPNGIRGTLTTLATIVDLKGETARAFRLAEQALEQARADGGEVATGMALNALAEIELRHDRVARAEGHALEALRALGAIDSERGVSWCWWLLARAAGARGEAARSATLLAAAVAYRERIALVAPPRQLEDQRRAADEARRALGDAAFEGAWAKGRTLDRTGANAYALAVPRRAD